MGWATRFTRFGDMHSVFAQELNISCGVACCIMAIYKYKKLVVGAKDTFTHKQIIDRATQLFGPNPLGSAGFNGAQMVQLLNDKTFGLAGWKFYSPLPTDLPQKIIDRVGVDKGYGPVLNVTPIITMINWTGSTDNHWVLIDTIRVKGGKHYATVCDPWDGNVHITPIQPGQELGYTGAEVSGATLAKRFNYAKTASSGKMSVPVAGRNYGIMIAAN